MLANPTRTVLSGSSDQKIINPGRVASNSLRRCNSVGVVSFFDSAPGVVASLQRRGDCHCRVAATPERGSATRSSFATAEPWELAMPPLRSGALRLTESRSGIPVRSVQQIHTQQFARAFDAVAQIQLPVSVRGIAPVHGAHLRTADFFALDRVGGDEDE